MISRPILTGALVLIGLSVGGVVFVSTRLTTQSQGSSTTWGVTEFIPTPATFSTKDAPPLEKRITESELFTLLSRSEERTYVTLTPKTNTYEILAPIDGVYAYENPSDVAALIDSIEPSAYIQTPNTDGSEITLDDIYGYLPQGLVSPPTDRTPRMTETQSALYDYANTVGSYIESYFDTWGTQQTTVMRQYFEDRTSAVKKATAYELADALENLSNDLSEVEQIPPALQKEHERLVSGYQALSNATRVIIDAEGDDAFLNAINASNAHADSFAKNYIAIVDILSTHTVTFTNTDPGRVFSFNAL